MAFTIPNLNYGLVVTRRAITISIDSLLSRIYTGGQTGCIEFTSFSLDREKRLQIENQRLSNLDEIWIGMPSLPTLHSVPLYAVF
jgi:hypothetical protein